MKRVEEGMRILVTGATGYIGGRLVPRLLERGYTVRVLVRDEGRIAGRPWFHLVEIAVGDLLDPDSVGRALEGIDVAYYLVHSMSANSDFQERDRRSALNFVEAGRGHLSHVIYLGGLLPEGAGVSAHLRSRAEVGEILRNGLPVTEFRAGPIIGSGSVSFEMVRYLTERLPMMIAPHWILNQVEPIAVRDVLSYLIAALDRAPLGVVDIGGERVTFRRMMEIYAEARGLTRTIVPVPVLAPKLAALWVGLVTPISNRLAVPLIEGVTHPVVADTARAEGIFPEIMPIDYRRAVELTLVKIDRGETETRWAGALWHSPQFELEDLEGVIREVRTVHVAAPAGAVFDTVAGLGGERGWPAWGWAWQLRGWMDRLAGGPGLRRGRRHPTELLAGEPVDFWRVEEILYPRLLRLRAEMKVPGNAWLQWEIVPEGRGTRLVQTAIFVPHGLWGALYWYLLYPVHRLIFSRMVSEIAHDAHARHVVVLS